MTNETPDYKLNKDSQAIIIDRVNQQGLQIAATETAITTLTSRITSAIANAPTLDMNMSLMTGSFKVTDSIIQAVVVDERVRAYGLPESQTVESAGYDLRAFPTMTDGTPLDQIILAPGMQVMVSTGLRVWINKPGWAGFMFARSGSGSKGLVLGNGTGVIDSDYQGPLKMCLWNRSNEDIVINAGDRVAQMTIMPVLTGYQLQIVDEFQAETERGQGGFGHTGVQ